MKRYIFNNRLNIYKQARYISYKCYEINRDHYFVMTDKIVPIRLNLDMPNAVFNNSNEFDLKNNFLTNKLGNDIKKRLNRWDCL